MEDKLIIVHCTVPSRDEALKIARTLVDKKMAACCSLVPQVTSVYQWENKTELSEEVLLIIKTSSRVYEHLEKEIKMIHSYSVPEIIAVDIAQASSAYGDWVKQSINQ